MVCRLILNFWRKVLRGKKRLRNNDLVFSRFGLGLQMPHCNPSGYATGKRVLIAHHGKNHGPVSLSNREKKNKWYFFHDFICHQNQRFFSKSFFNCLRAQEYDKIIINFGIGHIITKGFQHTSSFSDQY